MANELCRDVRWDASKVSKNWPFTTAETSPTGTDCSSSPINSRLDTFWKNQPAAVVPWEVTGEWPIHPGVADQAGTHDEHSDWRFPFRLQIKEPNFFQFQDCPLSLRFVARLLRELRSIEFVKFYHKGNSIRWTWGLACGRSVYMVMNLRAI